MDLFHQVYQMLSAQFSTNQFLSGAVLGGSVLGVLNSMRSLPSKMYHYIKQRLTVSITFDSQDKMFRYLQAWLYDNKFDKRQKRYHAYTVDSNKRSDTAPYIPKVILAPYSGTYLFRYMKKWMLLHSDKNEPSMEKGAFFIYEKVTISYFGISKKYINRLLEELCERYEEDSKRVARIYTAAHDGDYWNNSGEIIPRPIESVITRGDIVQTVKHKIEVFKESEETYLQRGVPYHYGLLFTGPPGTGKTSTSYVLASHFNMNVYYMSMSDTLTDGDFLSLMSNVGSNSLVMLEDIDTLFSEGREMKEGMRVTFSSLLNAIDGFCAKHGTILIMTTNHPEKLDAALTRPGRVDYEIEFAYCDHEQLRRMFLKFFPDQYSLADKFAGMLPEDEFSPAVIQNNLMTYDGQPQEAVKQAINIKMDANTPKMSVISRGGNATDEAIIGELLGD